MTKPDKWDEIAKTLWEDVTIADALRSAYAEGENMGMERAMVELIAAWNDDAENDIGSLLAAIRTAKETKE